MGDDSDSMDVTGDSDDDSDDDDDDSDDDDSDSIDVTGDSDDSDDDDSDDDYSDDDTDSDDDDSDDDDSDDDDSDDDSDDTDSDDDDSDDTDSDDDSDDTGSDDTDSSSNTGTPATTASAVSYCASLSSNQCSNAYADDGSAICAVNAVNQNCYAVVASSGMYGSGNFDDGYTAASHELEVETQKLNTIVGVLGGLVAVLVLLFIGGGYYFFKKSKLHEAQMQNMEVDDPTPHSMETGDCEPMMEAEE